MHYKERVTDQQEQQTCEANTENNQVIPPGSVGQTNSDRPFRRHSKAN